MPHTPEERAKLDRIAHLIERRPRQNNLSRYMADEELAMLLEKRRPRRPMGRRLQDGLLTALAWVIVAGALLGALVWMWLDKRAKPPGA